jgi:hypothetical protein
MSDHGVEVPHLLELQTPASAKWRGFLRIDRIAKAV